ncbi:MAG: peptidylprolyl isomerase, partial [Candidatus Muiribacteriaceae bacterium]
GLWQSRKMKQAKEERERQRLLREQEKNKVREKDEKKVLAKFGEEEITVGDFFEYFSKIDAETRRQYSDIKARENILDMLIMRKAVKTYAVLNNIGADEDEIIDSVIRMYGDRMQDTDRKRIKEMLDKGALRKDEFEYQIMQDKVMEKVSTPPEKIKEDTYRKYYEEHKWRYQNEEEYLIENILVKKDSEKREKEVEKDLNEEKLRRYYGNNKDKYMGVPAAEIRSIFVETAGLDVVVDESEAQDYYTSHKEEYMQEEEVKASHILVKSEKEAKEIMSRISENPSVFSELASEFSQDPGSKDKNGDLGWFQRGVMVPEFDKKVFSMNIGDISEPVKTNFGYHIIRLDDKKESYQKTYEEVAETIKEKLAEEKKWEKAEKKAQDISEQIREGNPFEILAAKYSDSLSSEEEGYVGWIKKGKNSGKNSYENELFENGRLLSVIEKTVFNMRNYEISDPVRTKFGYSIFKVLDKRDARPQPFTEVKDKVRDDYISWQKKIRAFNLIKKINRELNEKDADFKKLCREYSDGKTADDGGELPWFPLSTIPDDNTELKEMLEDEVAMFTYSFQNGQVAAGVAPYPEVAEAIRNLSEGEISDIVETEAGYHIIRLVDKRDGEIPPFKKIREEIIADLSISVPDSEVRDYYDENIEDYTEPEQIKAAVILTDDEQHAQTVYQKLKEGQDFADLAKEYSTDYTKEKGGDLGWVKRGERSEKFDKALFSLEVADFSEPFKTDFGYQIVKAVDRRPEKVTPFKEVREDIRQKLLKPDKERIFMKWIEEQKNKFGVEKEYSNYDYMIKYMN